MHSEHLVTHVLLFVICATAVVCLKKDRFFCELSSSCMCITVNDNSNIDLGGLNLTLTIADNQTLNYQPCVSEIVIVNGTSDSSIQVANYTHANVKLTDLVTFIYTNDESQHEFDVILVCDELAVSGNESLTNFKNVTANQCTVELKTSKVCGLNLSDAYENNPDSESWTYFFSFVLVVAFVYFVGGSVVNACLFNEIGINMIPHHAFWLSLYDKIKDKLCGTSTMATAYESI
ncbi:uncharacterized protein LOC111030297 [Myzus persicae]|uniref:uncharacterized protein LOC111030297 n=1 Tax=Myzus persicae TaxID=13164 RepID=UPI000B936E78|nr:uncharacterized protein LOC111030297 [Myzus persicae]